MLRAYPSPAGKGGALIGPPASGLRVWSVAGEPAHAGGPAQGLSQTHGAGFVISFLTESPQENQTSTRPSAPRWSSQHPTRAEQSAKGCEP